MIQFKEYFARKFYIKIIFLCHCLRAVQQKVRGMLLISYQNLSHSQLFLLQVDLKELCIRSLPVQNNLGLSAVSGSNFQFVNIFAMSSFSSSSKFFVSQGGFD